MKVVFWGEISPFEITQNMYTVAELLAFYMPSVQIRIFRRRNPDAEQPKRTARRSGKGTAKQKPNSCKKELSFYDCGNRSDAKTRRQIREADLVVINLYRDSYGWEHLGEYGIWREERTVFLVSGYWEVSNLRRFMEKTYRIDAGNIAVIPYNNEFQDAAERREAAKFLKRSIKRSEKNKMLNDELRRTVFLFQREISKFY